MRDFKISKIVSQELIILKFRDKLGNKITLAIAARMVLIVSIILPLLNSFCIGLKYLLKVYTIFF